MRAIRAVDSVVIRLVAFAVLVLLAGGALRYALALSGMRTGIEKLAESQQLALSSYVAADIDGKLRQRRHTLESLARSLSPLLDQPRAALDDWLLERQELSSVFSLGLMLVPTDGHGTLADVPIGSRRDRLDYGAEDWFVRVTQGAAFAVGTPRIGRTTLLPSLTLAVPVLDGRGRLRAVLAGVTALDTPGFLDLIQHSSKGSGLLLISPRDHLFVSASDPGLRLRPTPLPGVNPLHDQAMAGFRGAGSTINANGVSELSAITSVPTADWFVVARLPTDEALAPLHLLMRINLWSSLVIGVLVVSFLLVFLRTTLQPLRAAAAHMRRMADGEAPLAQLQVTRPDEVGQVVEGFNYLVEKLQQSEARLAALAHQDHLTGLPNRRAFFDQAGPALAQAHRAGSPLALLFIDIDGFKPINDAYSHLGGDELLRQFAARLRETVREGDLVTRFGGDEFMALLRGPIAPEALGPRVIHLIERLSASYPLDGRSVSVGASIGVAIFPEDATDLDRLVAMADAAMYEAKRNGPNQWRQARMLFPAA